MECDKYPMRNNRAPWGLPWGGNKYPWYPMGHHMGSCRLRQKVLWRRKSTHEAPWSLPWGGISTPWESAPCSQVSNPWCPMGSTVGSDKYPMGPHGGLAWGPLGFPWCLSWGLYGVPWQTHGSRNSFAMKKENHHAMVCYRVPCAKTNCLHHFCR